jgi:hypothetical protein
MTGPCRRHLFVLGVIVALSIVFIPSTTDAFVSHVMTTNHQVSTNTKGRFGMTMMTNSSDDFLSTVGERTMEEILDELFRLQANVDLDGLKLSSDDFLSTVGERTMEEILDELFRLQANVDLDGLKLLSIVLHSESQKQINGDSAPWAKFRVTKRIVEIAINIMEEEQAELYQRSINQAESTTLGLDKLLKHNHDLLAFQERVENLFDWYDKFQFRTYMAPYFSMIQSVEPGKLVC